jgi:HEAT repeat protein
MSRFNLLLMVGLVLGLTGSRGTPLGRADPTPKEGPLASRETIKAELRKLEKQLDDPDPKIHGQAARALGLLTEDVNQMARALDAAFGRANEDPDTLVIMLKAVAQMGPSGKPWAGIHVPRYLNHPVADVRAAAAQAVLALAYWQAAPELVPLLKDADLRVRRHAAGALTLFGSQARWWAAPAVPVLIENMMNRKGRIRKGDKKRGRESFSLTCS